MRYFIFFVTFENNDAKFVVGVDENDKILFLKWDKETDGSKVLIMNDYDKAQEFAQYVADNFIEYFENLGMAVKEVQVYEIV